MQAEVDNRPFTYTGLDPNLALQAAIFAQRKSEYNYKLENYRQKADSLSAHDRARQLGCRRLPRPAGRRDQPGKDAQRTGAAAASAAS